MMNMRGQYTDWSRNKERQVRLFSLLEITSLHFQWHQSGKNPASEFVTIFCLFWQICFIKAARFFHNLGRGISSHPYMCISASLCLLLLACVPMLYKMPPPSAAPIDIHWSLSFVSAGSGGTPPPPAWLSRAPLSTVYVQQLAVTAWVQPDAQQYSTPTVIRPEQVVRAALGRAFAVWKAAHSTLQAAGNDWPADICYTLPESPQKNLPFGCAVLSPTHLWGHDLRQYEQDSNVLNRLRDDTCSGGKLCVRELLLGVPNRHTGIKDVFRTNRPNRIINFAVTIFLRSYNEKFTQHLVQSLNASSDLSVHPWREGKHHFAYVFYRPQKYGREYLPLGLSYLLLVCYVYSSASKLEMVRSKSGLTMALVCTVASSIIAATSICTLFDLTPSLWGAELFPYLAMMIGLENTLCITRSVVWTPVSMDVRARIAHGLSKEGWSITKYLLAELGIVALGYFTFIQEIQEFCAFAIIGLLCDMFLLLFFYTPCLTLELLGLGSEEKHRIKMRQFQYDQMKHESYPPVRCPFKKWLPSQFYEQPPAPSGSLTRYPSDSNIPSSTRHRGHRRATSDVKMVVDKLQLAEIPSRRLRLLYFWTRTRIFQRFLMVVAVVWILWFAAIVYQWTVLTSYLPDAQKNVESMLHTHCDWWQRRSFKLWPVFFDQYNVSLSGNFLTILPPIVMNASIPRNDPLLQMSFPSSPSPNDHEASYESDSSDPRRYNTDNSGELGGRVSWLELQMSMVWLSGMSTGILLMAVLIGVYVCYQMKYHDLTTWYTRSETTSALARLSAIHRSKLPSSNAMFDAVTVRMNGHELPVQQVLVVDKNTLVSCCLGSQVIVWRASTDTQLASRQVPGGSIIWCMAHCNQVLILGCADGAVLFYDLQSLKTIGTFRNPDNNQGVTHVRWCVDRVIVVRLLGSFECLSVSVNDHQQMQTTLVSATRAHHKSITVLAASEHRLCTGSADCSIKLYNQRNAVFIATLSVHQAAITDLVIDSNREVLYSSCALGQVACWQTSDGTLLLSLHQAAGNNLSLHLAFNHNTLVAFCAVSGHLWLWCAATGQLITRLSTQIGTDPNNNSRQQMPWNGADGARNVLVFAQYLAATTFAGKIQIWDLRHPILRRELQLGDEQDGLWDSVVGLQQFDHLTLVCAHSQTLYKINFPRFTSN